MYRVQHVHVRPRDIPALIAGEGLVEVEVEVEIEIVSAARIRIYRSRGCHVLICGRPSEAAGCDSDRDGREGISSSAFIGLGRLAQFDLWAERARRW